MLTQDAVLKNLNTEQERQLFLLSMDHKEIKQTNLDIFSNLNDLPTNLLYAKKMINDSGVKNAEMKNSLSDFIKTPLAIDQQTAGYLEDYIKVKYK